MKRKYLFLLLIICISVLFIGFTNRNIDKNPKENIFQSSEDNYLEEEILKSKKAKIYALAFDAVWDIDSGLNYKIRYISVNTKTFKDFNEEDKRQLFDYIENKYYATMLDMNFYELKDAGYIGKGSLGEESFNEGILFEVDKYRSYSSNSVVFEGMKFRTGLAAIGFSFEAENKNNKWELIKCERTWIA